MARNGLSKSILLVVLSTAFSLLVIEGFLKWQPQFQAPSPLERFVSCAGSTSRMRAHEIFGWTEAPNHSYFEQQTEADGWAVHIYNPMGFRDLFDSGTDNVIVLGDSFTRGTLVNNDETFPHLLDLWNPTLAFHNFGTGGFGTANSLAVYEFMSSKIDHKLVILAYFMGNDLARKSTASFQASWPTQDELPNKARNRSSYEALKAFNDAMRRIRVYNLMYHALRSAFGRPSLSHEQIEEGAKVTSALISELAKAVQANGADLLIVAIPSWNQIKNYRDVEEAIRQRAVLQRIAEEWDNVYVADLSDAIARAGPERVYGIHDKHFSRYGYYLTAKFIHDWINFEWPDAPRPARQAPPFQPPSTAVEPDCALMPQYREAFIHPAASRREATAELRTVGRSAPTRSAGPEVMTTGHVGEPAGSGAVPDADRANPEQLGVERHLLHVGRDRRLAYQTVPGKLPGVLFCGGYTSDMTGTKALAPGSILSRAGTRLRPLRLFGPRRLVRRFRRRHDRWVDRRCSGDRRSADRRTSARGRLEHGRLDHAARGARPVPSASPA